MKVKNRHNEVMDIEVGSYVGFKCDVEQYGKITKIKSGNGRVTLVLENPEGFYGGYIGGQTTHTIDADQCWQD